MIVKQYLIFFVLLLFHWHETECQKVLGNAEMIYKRILDCPNSSYDLIQVNATKNKFNRTHTFYEVSGELSIPVDENIGVLFNASRWGDGGWKPFFLLQDDNACQQIKRMLGDLFVNLLNLAGLEDCPIPAGTYYIPNLTIGPDDITVPQVYGEYMVEMSLTQGMPPQTIACWIAYIDYIESEKDSRSVYKFT